MKERYIIYGSVDNGKPNLNIFFITEDKAEAEEVYEKIERLSDLQFPETRELKKEHAEIYKELQGKGIEIFSEDEKIEDGFVEWTLRPMVKISKVKENEKTRTKQY